MAPSRQTADVRLNGKYLKEAEQLLTKGDYPQASEKFGGAAAEIIKATAAKRGRDLGTHRKLGEFIVVLEREHPDWGFIDAFKAANTLHMNFYEDWLPPALVEKAAERIRGMVTQLRRLL